MGSKLLQIKLAVDMILVSLVLFNSEISMEVKIFVALVGFDYTMLSSERIDKKQQEEKK